MSSSQLVDWIREEEKNKLPSASIKILDGIRGLYSQEHIKEGDIIISIDARFMITAKMAKDWFHSGVSNNYDRKLSNNAYMGIWFIT
jgi:hypothetical protein